MSDQEIIIVDDVHFSKYDRAKSADFARHYWGTFDYALLEQNALNHTLFAQGTMVDGLPVPNDIIECTDYRELEPEPLLLPPGEAKDVQL